MIFRGQGADRELRFAEWVDTSPPSPGYGVFSASGVAVSARTTYGLPAAMQAIRQPSVLVASLDLCVFRGKNAEKREVEDDWRVRLLRTPDGGVGDGSVFDWWSDMCAAVEGFGNGFARKVRGVGSRLRGQVVALEPIHPECVWVRRRDGVKTFSVHTDGRTVDGLTSADILHVRGFSVGPGVAAPSPVEVHRNPLGVAVAQEEFQGAYFRNNATPPTIVQFPEGVSEEAAKAWLALWTAQHQGLGNQGKVGVVGAGATVTTLPLSLRDAQFIDSQQFSIEQIGRIFNWPAWALDHNEAKETEAAESRARNLLTFYLGPRLKRLERALSADPDLFGGSDLYPEFRRDGLISVDAATQAEVDHKDVQSGVMLKDEIRARRGVGPLPDGVGQIPQVTPVGGGPNPDPLPTQTDTGETNE